MSTFYFVGEKSIAEGAGDIVTAWLKNVVIDSFSTLVKLNDNFYIQGFDVLKQFKITESFWSWFIYF